MPWPPLLLYLLFLDSLVALCRLPFGKFPLTLFAVIVFPYLRDKKAGKSFDNRLWKFDFIGCFADTAFPLSKTQFKARRREKQGKGKLFFPPEPFIYPYRRWPE